MDIAAFIAVAVGVTGANTCASGIRWHPGIQVHDIHPASDLGNIGAVEKEYCAELCCATKRCVAFFHTEHQAAAMLDLPFGDGAGPLPNNCTSGKSCCWLKPTFNSSRTTDFCAVRSDCNSGSFVHAGVPTTEIAPGVHMPLLMMGGYNISGNAPNNRPSNYSAWLALGGRGIDTAWEYDTQPQIKAAIDASGIRRENLFITSKIPCSEHSHRFPNPMTKAAATKFITDDLEQMGLTYIDLMLVHWPCVTAAETAAVWSAMEDMLESKQLRALGVSNFKQADIEALAASATVQPAVNQCSMAAGKTDDATLAYCQAHNITYEAYGGLQGGHMENPQVVAIAEVHNATAAEVLLRWIIQQRVVSVTGSMSAVYDAEDVNIFDFVLSDDEMQTLAKL